MFGKDIYFACRFPQVNFNVDHTVMKWQIATSRCTSLHLELPRYPLLVIVKPSGVLVSKFSIEKKVVAFEIVGICIPIAATQILHIQVVIGKQSKVFFELQTFGEPFTW